MTVNNEPTHINLSKLAALVTRYPLQVLMTSLSLAALISKLLALLLLRIHTIIQSRQARSISKNIIDGNFYTPWRLNDSAYARKIDGEIAAILRPQRAQLKLAARCCYLQRELVILRQRSELDQGTAIIQKNMQLKVDELASALILLSKSCHSNTILMSKISTTLIIADVYLSFHAQEYEPHQNSKQWEQYADHLVIADSLQHVEQRYDEAIKRLQRILDDDHCQVRDLDSIRGKIIECLLDKSATKYLLTGDEHLLANQCFFSADSRKPIIKLRKFQWLLKHYFSSPELNTPSNSKATLLKLGSDILDLFADRHSTDWPDKLKNMRPHEFAHYLKAYLPMQPGHYTANSRSLIEDTQKVQMWQDYMELVKMLKYHHKPYCY